MRRSLLYCLLLLCCAYANSQQLPLKMYSVDDGLISKEITAIIRDDKGLLWVGTPFGVSWFDGKNFYAPQLELKTGQLYVTNFFKDSEGSVWVLTFYNGLYRFKNNKFTNYLPAATLEQNANSVFDMVEVDKGLYLLATDQNMYWFDGSTFSVFDSTRPELKVQFTSVACPTRTTIVFGNDHGLFWYRFENNHWVRAKILYHAIHDLFSDGDSLWIATNKGLYLYKEPFNLNTAPSSIYLPGQSTGTITKDTSGAIWLTASGNICHLSNEQVTTYTESNGVPQQIKNLYCGRENIKWIATGEGLYKLYKPRYDYDNLRMLGVNALVSQMAKDRDNNLWIGTYDGLIKKDDTSYKTYSTVNGKKIGYVSWLYQSSNSHLYAGTNAGMIKIENDKLLPLHTIQTSVISEDDSAVFWMGTIDGKIFRYDHEKLEEIQAEKIHADFIDGIYRDKEGFLWIGYRGSGIKKYRIDQTKLIPVKEFSANTGFPDLRVRCAYPDSKGNIIFGTRTNGIFIFSIADDKKYWHFNTKNGLSANWVKSITIDENHRLYLATNNGINTISGDYDHPFINRLGINDNSIPAETNNVLFDNGKLWIGMNGLLNYDLSEDTSQQKTIPVFLTEISIDGQPDSSFMPYSKPGNTVRLHHNQHVVAFEFAGIHLTEDIVIYYRYMLQGLDREWSQPTTRNYMSYNLKPGSYMFKVQARNAAGEWSKDVAVYSFIIAQPFWRTDWFIVSCTFLISLVPYLLYRYRLRQVLKLEKLRNRISTDLHDDIGSTLSSISILSEMTLKTEDKKQSADMVQEIKAGSVTLMEKMDDIVWSINPKNDSLENLMLRIKRFASKLFEAKDIDYSIDIDESINRVKLSMEYRQHIYLILKEAINNLVKYAACTQASIGVNYKNDFLEVTVKDNGSGFDPQNTVPGTGIASMYHRAKLMKAELTIRSSLNQWTIVSLKVKIK